MELQKKDFSGECLDQQKELRYQMVKLYEDRDLSKFIWSSQLYPILSLEELTEEERKDYLKKKGKIT